MIDVIKQDIIEGKSLASIEKKLNITFGKLKKLTEDNNFLIAPIYADLYSNMLGGYTFDDLRNKYIITTNMIGKCIQDNINLEEFVQLLQGQSISVLTRKSKSPINFWYKIAKKVNYTSYSRHTQNISQATSMYSTGDYSKKELSQILNIPISRLNKHISNTLIKTVTDLYLEGYNDSYIAAKVGITIERLDQLFVLHSIKLKKHKKKQINIDEFKFLYLDKRYTYKQLADHFDCSMFVIYKMISDNKITRGLKQYEFDREQLYSLYITQNKTQQELSEIFGCCQNTIDRALEFHSITKNNSYSYRESNIEKKIRVLLDTLNVNYIQNSRKIIAPLELDFFLPDYDIAIEVCGLYWHSTKVNSNQHHIYDKYKICNNLGIRLITIFEDEIIYKPKIVENRVAIILNRRPSDIYARQCIIKQLLPDIGSAFLNTYHLQGSGNNSIYLGAFYEDNLMAVMSFSKPSIAKGASKTQWELNRFASIDSIPGIASKLFKFFIKNNAPESIISYADLRWNTGNLYNKLGFKHIHDSRPNYWYIDQLKRKHRFNFTKHKVLQLYPKEDPNQTAIEITDKHGLPRIYDCGNAVFRWENVKSNEGN